MKLIFMFGKNYSVLIALILLFSGIVHADVLVSISQKDSIGEAVFYPEEVETFNIAVFNAGQDEQRPLTLKVSVDSDFSILDSDKEKREKYFTIKSISAGERKNFDIIIKAKKASKNSKTVSVFYGFNSEKLENSVSINVYALDNKVDISVSLKNFIVDIGKEGSVLFSMKNNSNQDLNSISIELYSFQRVDVSTPKLYIQSLNAGDELKEKEFVFSPDPVVSGNIPVILKVSYADSNGFHVIEKQLNVIVESAKFFNSIVLVIILILIIILSFLLRKPDAQPAKK